MILNLNIGILGHVDSGKTTLAKALSQIPSTAAFDKNPQSQERGITLDLGFSAYQCPLPDHLKESATAGQYASLQLTFVDCPGHAKLIRTIIGGAQIIDLIILVVDINKGIQTQTAECLVIGELTGKQLVVALNKIDLIDASKTERTIEKMTKKIRSILSTGTVGFTGDVSIVPVSAERQTNLEEFLNILKMHAVCPTRELHVPFLFAVDHCFQIKGQGTVCTGTVLQGAVKVNDDIEVVGSGIRQTKRVKSIQMLRKPMQTAQHGDRAGLCITQFDSDLLERGFISRSDYVKTIAAAIVKLQPIKYYKGTVASGSKYHVTVGYETVMAKCTMFTARQPLDQFDWAEEYEYLPELEPNAIDLPGVSVFVLLEFEKPILAVPKSLVIVSKLDGDINSNLCRLIFWGHLDVFSVDLKNCAVSFLANLKVFKRKCRQGTIQRVINSTEIIVDRLYKKESNRQTFIGLTVELSTGEKGILDSTFGATTKVKVRLLGDGLTAETMSMIKNKSAEHIEVHLRFKKFLYWKSLGNKILQ